MVMASEGSTLSLLYPINAEFIEHPKSVVVTVGENASFSCIVNGPLEEWFINGNVPIIRSGIPHMKWSGCTSGDPMHCGGTLFIKKVDLSLNGTNVSCSAAYRSCDSDSRKVEMSRLATIIGKSKLPHDIICTSYYLSLCLRYIPM